MDEDRQHTVGDLWIKAKKINRNCMYGECMETAINSHVLQKNGILNQIAEDGHLVAIKENFYSDSERLEIGSTGVNNTYCFKGFCIDHDTKLFNEIENRKKLKFNQRQQLLFAYRCLCNELHRKEVAYNFSGSLIRKEVGKIESLEKMALFTSFRAGTSQALRELNQLKALFENSLINNDFSIFDLSIFDLPILNICVSTLLNIGSNTDSISEPTIINIFPYNNRAKVLFCNLKSKPSTWAESQKEILLTGKDSKKIKVINDIIVLRAEFWVMSPALYRSIPKKELENFKKEVLQNAMDHSEGLTTDVKLLSS